MNDAEVRRQRGRVYIADEFGAHGGGCRSGRRIFNLKKSMDLAERWWVTDGPVSPFRHLPASALRSPSPFRNQHPIPIRTVQQHPEKRPTKKERKSSEVQYGRQAVKRGRKSEDFSVHFWSFFFCLRGGVTGRPMFIPPYGYFAFFSAGLRIWKEHNNVSSTLIIAPALSNSPQ